MFPTISHEDYRRNILYRKETNSCALSFTGQIPHWIWVFRKLRAAVMRQAATKILLRERASNGARVTYVYLARGYVYVTLLCILCRYNAAVYLISNVISIYIIPTGRLQALKIEIHMQF